MTTIERVLLEQTAQALTRLHDRKLEPLAVCALLQAVVPSLGPASTLRKVVDDTAQRLASVLASDADPVRAREQALLAVAPLRARLATGLHR